jgi:hypothetical protein
LRAATRMEPAPATALLTCRIAAWWPSAGQLLRGTGLAGRPYRCFIQRHPHPARSATSGAGSWCYAPRVLLSLADALRLVYPPVLVPGFGPYRRGWLCGWSLVVGQVWSDAWLLTNRTPRRSAAHDIARRAGRGVHLVGDRTNGCRRHLCRCPVSARRVTAIQQSNLQTPWDNPPTGFTLYRTTTVIATAK